MGPRERYASTGPDGQGDAELLALVIGTAAGGRSALAIAHALLDRFQGVRGVREAPLAALAGVAGIGPARAVRIHAALHLGGRAARPRLVRGTRLATPHDAWRLLSPRLLPLPVEELHALYLDRRHRLLAHVVVSRGNDHLTVVDPRAVFRPALQVGAAAVVVAHNHPSGDPEPSPEDLAVTRRLARAGHVLAVQLADHLVIADGGWTSLAERGHIPQATAPAALVATRSALAERIREAPHVRGFADDDEDVARLEQRRGLGGDLHPAVLPADGHHEHAELAGDRQFTQAAARP